MNLYVFLFAIDELGHEFADCNCGAICARDVQWHSHLESTAQCHFGFLDSASICCTNKLLLRGRVVLLLLNGVSHLEPTVGDCGWLYQSPLTRPAE